MKKLIRASFEFLAARYLRRHKPTLVVITGSVGKTSTKLAIATVLSEKLRVRAHDGNHNADISVPLAIMGVRYPAHVRSPLGWSRAIIAALIRINRPKDVDVIVQELGTDHPGDIAGFMRYLRPDMAVVTAVSPEHMEYFVTIDAVAREELAIASVAKLTLINRDDVDESYAKYADTHDITTYGLSDKAEYYMRLDSTDPLVGKMATFVAPEWGEVPVNVQVVGEHNVKAVAAAGAVAARLGFAAQEIAVGMAKIRPAPGRMQLLKGLNHSVLIDDTYNSSPLATSAALQTLYRTDTPQRIVILGSMNELGAVSADAHATVGKLCDPAKLEWVVTIGEQAANYLAPAAKERGCQVRIFMSPYEAGGFVHSVLRRGAVVLAKGSQNGVFAEEALKVLLHDSEDEARLVRQSPHWLRIKQRQFAVDVKDDSGI